MGRIVGLIPEPEKPQTQTQEKKQVKNPASKPVKSSVKSEK